MKWNVDAQQRQRYHTWAESCYIMSVSNILSHLLVSIMLLLQDRVTITFIVKFKINNIAFTIKDSLEDQSNWNIDWITPLVYVINICLPYRVYFGWHCSLVNDLVAIFHQPTTFSWRYIAFRISCLSCNSYWSKWPKTCLGDVCVFVKINPEFMHNSVFTAIVQLTLALWYHMYR